MAEMVDSMPESGREDYPWDEWFNGRAWKLVKGKDFFCKPENFRSSVRYAAMKRGFWFRFSQKRDVVHLQKVDLPPRGR